MITLEIQGLEKFLTIVDPHRFAKEMDIAVNRAAEMLRDEAKRMPAVSARTTGYGTPGLPVDSGRMRQSIQKQRLGLLAAGVVVPVNYSGYVHQGTGKMPARPFFRWLLEDFHGVEMVQGVLTDALERIAVA